MKTTFKIGILCVLLFQICFLISWTPSTTSALSVTRPNDDRIQVEKSKRRQSVVVSTQSAVTVQASRPNRYPVFQLRFDTIFQSSELEDFATENLVRGTKKVASADKYTIGEHTFIGGGRNAVSFNVTTTGTRQGYSFTYHLAEDGTTDVKFDLTVHDVRERDWAETALYRALCWKMVRQDKQDGPFVEIEASDPTVVEKCTTLAFTNGTTFTMQSDAKTEAGVEVESHLKPSGKFFCAVYKKFTGTLEHSAVMKVSGSSSLLPNLSKTLATVVLAALTLSFVLL